MLDEIFEPLLQPEKVATYIKKKHFIIKPIDSSIHSESKTISECSRDFNNNTKLNKL